MSATRSTLDDNDRLDAAGLLDDYRAGHSSVFVSPSGTLLAEGVHSEVATSGLADLPEQVAAVLATRGHPVRTVVGAVPFAPDAPARLIVPQRLRRAARPGTGSPATGSPATGSPATGSPATGSPGNGSPGTVRPGITTAVPAPSPARDSMPPIHDNGYVAAVARAVEQIRAGAYTKVVLARALHLAASDVDPAPVVRALALGGAGSYTYGIDLGGGRTLFGASPELLVARQGRTVTANPLAGSIPRSTDPVEDARRAAGLLESAKDLHEHTFASEAVAEGLHPFCRDLRVPSEPTLTATPTMWHLGSRITGEIIDPDVSSLALAAALHPTPAVCGTPATDARRAIAELEPFDRGFFAGMVGWSDASGDGEWAVTIRCATVGPDGLDIYAGAGIVADSDPWSELAETTAKMGTMLTALGVLDVTR